MGTHDYLAKFGTKTIHGVSSVSILLINIFKVFIFIDISKEVRLTLSLLFLNLKNIKIDS